MPSNAAQAWEEDRRAIRAGRHRPLLLFIAILAAPLPLGLFPTVFILLGVAVLIGVIFAIDRYEKSRPGYRPAIEEYTPGQIRTGLRVVTTLLAIILAGQSLILARALGETWNAFYLPALTAFQDWLAASLSTFLPTLRKMPEALAAEGFDGRISIVVGCYATGYLVSIALGICLIRPMWRASWIVLGNKALYERLIIREPRFSYTRYLALAISPLFVAICALENIISRPVRYYRRTREIFPHFEERDVDLIYRAIYGPSFWMYVIVFCVVVGLVVWIDVFRHWGARRRERAASGNGPDRAGAGDAPA